MRLRKYHDPGIVSDRGSEIVLTRQEVADLKRASRILARLRELLRKQDGVGELEDCIGNDDLDLIAAQGEHACDQIVEEQPFRQLETVACFGVEI